MKNFQKYLAEFIGTFALVFCGTGAIVIDQHTNGAVSHLGIAMTFGLIVSAMIFALGDVSGAHLNPAVTISFALAKRFPVAQIVPYFISQILGALLASVLLKFLFPFNQDLGATIPQGSAMQSFILEIVLTMILVMVIFNVSSGSKEKGTTAAIAIGSVVGLEAMFAGPISGASMNPFRSLAPAMVSSNMEHIWIYLSAPVIGAILGVCIHQVLFKNNYDSTSKKSL